MLHKRLAIVFCLTLLGAAAGTGLYAQTDSEDDFFSSPDVETDKGESDAANVAESIEGESTTLSGNLQATGNYIVTRDFFRGLADMDDNAMNYYLTGDFLLDIRLRSNFKAFVDLNIGYSNVGMPALKNYYLVNQVGTTLPGTLFIFSEDQEMLIGIKEIFIDFNISNVVYFRVGKQVLQWGLGYLWNPTDLINIEKKSFLDMEALRDGTFGTRIDVVFSRYFHLYTFINLQGAEDLSDLAVAGRAEFLVGQTEFGVSGWAKGGKIPVFGFDLSAPLFWDLNFYTEASGSWGSNLDKMATDGSVYSIRDRLVPRITVGLSRFFDVGDEEDKLMINAEFYYNDAGYEDNMFEVLTNPLDLADFLQKYYSSGDYGKYYGALFLTINKFILSDMTLTLSGIGNFSDLSFMAVADLSYSPVYNFTISFQLIAYLGADFREYTIAVDPAAGLGNNMFAGSLSCSVKF